MNHRLLITNLRYHRASIAAFGMLMCMVVAGFALVIGLVTGIYDWLVNGSRDLPSPFLWGLWAICIAFILMIGNKRALDFDNKVAQASIAMATGRYAEAEAAFRGLLADKAAPSVDDPRRGDLLAWLTYLARAQGNYDDAESFGQQWLSGAERVWGPNHWRVINTIQELAAIYIDIARYSQAKPLLERSLRMLDVKPTPDRLALMRCLGLMGRMYHEARHDDKAQIFSQRAFEVFSPERVWGDFPEVAFDFITSLVSAGKIEAAEAVLRTGHDLVRKTSPAESSQRARLLGALADVGFAQKLYAEAEKLMRESLVIWEKLSPDHPNNSGSWSSLGNILTAQRKFSEAEECYKHALRVCHDYKAPEHPVLASILEDYGKLLQKLGRTAEAFELHHHAAEIREFQAKHPID